MHELSLCHSIVAIAEVAARGRRVRVVELDVGNLRQVVPATLAYCWDFVTPSTTLEGSTLKIHSIEGTLKCQDCLKETTLRDTPILVCDFCESTKVDILTGEEFMVTSLVLED
ncbi:MAG: hydrogenase maturation nickel metallochaperone HypA [Propionibacteriaceae bacterium]|nr:hydrogenase maturation nickel metallochaperone HypA [Propionibacteriaceae bacterium]